MPVMAGQGRLERDARCCGLNIMPTPHASLARPQAVQRSARSARLSRTRSTTAAPPAFRSISRRRAQPIPGTLAAHPDRQTERPSHVHLLFAGRRRHPAICLRPHQHLLRSHSLLTPPRDRYSTPQQSTHRQSPADGAPRPPQIHRVRDGCTSRQVLTPVPRVYLSDNARRTHAIRQC